jgi:hypothetical protein
MKDQTTYLRSGAMFFLRPIILLATVATVRVSATVFCQCEDDRSFKIFPGINNICKKLNGDWCSANCDIFKGNCDYCQYPPAGYAPIEDIDKLRGWYRGLSFYKSGKTWTSAMLLAEKTFESVHLIEAAIIRTIMFSCDSGCRTPQTKTHFLTIWPLQLRNPPLHLYRV